MPSLFSKHLHLCFFKPKYPTILCQHSHHTPPPSSADNSDATSSTSTEPDFASIFASQRFFFSSPGTSNSIVESPDTRTFVVPTGGGVGVPKYSLNPYVDFLRSMQEMIRSRQVLDITKDSEYLHELLLCYLALNPTHTHKHILRAFTDLVLELLSSTTPCRTTHNHNSHRRHRSLSGRLL
ncbi:hypothetical protein AAZX31_10G235100 [Glycine max]|uniref:Transcription repressor n=2 Tax=Glycine subgen. Soja TaxID=1462606 RepID=K7LL92_SOYBN|nr:transcription repressor OFP12 [Glycine max]XP_028183894.1 transcription repressor OFP12-like [Glycine soja]KAG5005114.1 hypothetical protein JHK86_029253 [Glycine max]KAG5128309.1 hypothetical protein JHK82_029144 [Glycine max]KAG5152914.1 hypothetical protein JHK84_029386 [Glycine max]KAH1139945.1 hypothetical protein GYH30_029034 [Glycine max]KAH1230847.1 Transcription repressor OFP12 [Glycine max]|eukprot:XP_014618854.1 transcription repressor OFP12 [Glycine max]